jgi:hypothetical protein
MSDFLPKRAKVIKNEPKHFNKDEGIIFNYDEEFDLGIGQFEPEKKENYSPIPEEKIKKQQPFYIRFNNIDSRYGCFLYSNEINKGVFFRNNYEEGEEIDSVNDIHVKQYKIIKAIEKIKKFDLPNQFGYAIFLDNPNKMPFQINLETFHTDKPPMTFLSNYTQEFLKNLKISHESTDNDQSYKTKNSKYTLIEYTNNCVSTTVKNRYNEADYIRFWACPGTVICIENTTQKHSTPFVIEQNSIIDRTIGNELIIEQKDEIRELYRTQILPVTEEIFNSLIRYQIEHPDLAKNIYDVVELSASDLEYVNSIKPFETKFDLRDYVNNPENRIYEAGKKMRKSRKTRKNKKVKKNRKAKKTR